MRHRMKPASDFKEFDWILWDFKTWYEVGEGVKNVGGWVFLPLKGHPLSVCTIWHTVELPHSLYRELAPSELCRALLLLPAER